APDDWLAHARSPRPKNPPGPPFARGGEERHRGRVGPVPPYEGRAGGAYWHLPWDLLNPFANRSSGMPEVTGPGSQPSRTRTGSRPIPPVEVAASPAVRGACEGLRLSPRPRPNRWRSTISSTPPGRASRPR